MSTTIDTYQRLAADHQLGDVIEIMNPLGKVILVYNCDQGEQEWKNLHMGRPTASQFHRIMTPAKQQIAEGRWSYLYELAIERLLNQPRAEIGHLDNVQRGSVLEKDAFAQYAFVHGRKPIKVGFIAPSHGKWGCSPDGLFCDDPLGGVEFKAPKPETHLKYWNEARNPGTAYKCQVQGAMLITGLPRWELISYHPNLPEVAITFHRDDEFCEKLEKCLLQFCGELDSLERQVREEGITLPSVAPAANDIDGWRKIMEAHPGAWAIG